MTEKVIDREWPIRFIKAAEKDDPSKDEFYGTEYFCVDELKWISTDILDYEEHDPSHTVLKHYPYEGNDIQAVIDFLMGFFNIKREELK